MPAPTPSITISSFDGDNIINAQELTLAPRVSGTASGLNSKDSYTVKITVTDTYGIIVDTYSIGGLHANGSGKLTWNLNQGTVSNLTDGQYTVNAFLFDTTQSQTTPIATT